MVRWKLDFSSQSLILLFVAGIKICVNLQIQFMSGFMQAMNFEICVDLVEYFSELLRNLTLKKEFDILIQLKLETKF